jgi:hypothetical protein
MLTDDGGRFLLTILPKPAGWGGYQIRDEG